MKQLFLFLALLSSLNISGQQHSHLSGRKMKFPDVKGYKTFTCDFHIHTVFSDGSVWPDIRVQEAVQDGLDAISLTEHLEYQPHKDDLPHPDRNKSYELAMKEAKAHDLIVIHGAEITRRMPPGHNNAIFIENANKLIINDSIEVFREANRQHAFVFWNHPNWMAQRTDGIATVTNMHKKLVEENLLHGIEVVNENTYSDEALQIALDHHLTIMGTSDIHGLVDWNFKVADGGHRPITLVLAKERTASSISQALRDRRTIAYFRNLLIGRDSLLRPMLESILTIESASYIGSSTVLEVEINNSINTDITAINKTGYTTQSTNDVLLFKPGKNKIEFKTRQALQHIDLALEVLNGVTAPNKHPIIHITKKIN